MRNWYTQELPQGKSHLSNTRLVNLQDKKETWMAYFCRKDIGFWDQKNQIVFRLSLGDGNYCSYFRVLCGILERQNEFIEENIRIWTDHYWGI